MTYLCSLSVLFVRSAGDKKPNDSQNLLLFDLSIWSTETKYIKLNTKTQNIFCYVNKKLTTFFIHFDRGDKKTEGEKKIFFFKVYTKVECY